MVLDFRHAQYTLTTQDNIAITHSFFSQNTNLVAPTVNFYLALSPAQYKEEVLQSIRSLTAKADTDIQGRVQLEGLMLGWPTVCTHDIGHTTLV